ncbi:AAA family ATPase [Candidatus Microgenomates bacterium]|nr:AAA family ATPase [Candidatus Microgenomates bacterium]
MTIHDRSPELDIQAIKEATAKSRVLRSLRGITYSSDIADPIKDEERAGQIIGRKIISMAIDPRDRIFLLAGISGSGKTTVLYDIQRHVNAAGHQFELVRFGKHFVNERDKDPDSPMTQERRLIAMDNMVKEVRQIQHDNPNAKIGIETLVMPSMNVERGAHVIQELRNDSSLHIVALVHTPDISIRALLTRMIIKESKTPEEFINEMRKENLGEWRVPDIAYTVDGWKKIQKVVSTRIAQPSEILAVREEEVKVVEALRNNPVFKKYYEQINILRQFKPGALDPAGISEVGQRAALTRFFLEYYLSLDPSQFDIVINEKVEGPYLLEVPKDLID